LIREGRRLNCLEKGRGLNCLEKGRGMNCNIKGGDKTELHYEEKEGGSTVWKGERRLN
jgi:hypothetical protein